MFNQSKLLKSAGVSLSLAAFFFASIVSPGLAQSSTQPATPSAEATVSADPYVLFWPVVAGRTLGDRFYFLKTTKEKLAGMFTFRASKKAEYEIFLATKRLLEAEKLTKEEKKDNALKTVNAAKAHLEKAKAKLNSSKDSKVANSEAVKKLSNINVFLPQLKEISDQDVDTILDQIATLAQELQGKLQ